jgi:phosphoribosylglycinamide formyltransferase 1
MTRIAVFASGTGSNAKKIIEKFNGHPSIFVTLVVCNKPGAGVLQIAADNHIDILLIEKETFFRGGSYLKELSDKKIDFIVLAGFLWKLPAALISAFAGRIINIHPALLPKFGGKGMYGNKVHEAVIAAHEKISGITIHFVDEHYDNGDIIFQDTIDIAANDTAESLAEKIHELEHRHFPNIIEQVIDLQNQR